MWKKLFGSGRKKTYEIPKGPDPELFHMVWERKRLPSPGAKNYAYETLALKPVSPISSAVAVRNPIFKPVQTTPQPYATKQGIIVGVPTVAGQMVMQPIFDPASGYSGPWPVLNNTPFPRAVIAPAGKAI